MSNWRRRSRKAIKKYKVAGNARPSYLRHASLSFYFVSVPWKRNAKCAADAYRVRARFPHHPPHTTEHGVRTRRFLLATQSRNESWDIQPTTASASFQVIAPPHDSAGRHQRRDELFLSKCSNKFSPSVGSLSRAGPAGALAVRFQMATGARHRLHLLRSLLTSRRTRSLLPATALSFDRTQSR